MSLADLLTRVPRPFDPDRGRSVAERFGDLDPSLRELIAGTAGSSPFLAGLLEREEAWVREALYAPGLALADLIDGLPTEGDLTAPLREAKRRVALMLALADLSGAMSWNQVTETLTRFADRAVDCALNALVLKAMEQGILPGVSAPSEAGLVALAMGKMGAGELNYSSDIDLIMLFDESRHDPSDLEDIRAGMIKVTRRMAALLSDVTAEGYVFRTDLRLRPDASVTPVCISMGAAERYYESVGRTWERAAYIKARPAAGHLVAGEGFLKTLQPFIYRRYLDFAAIEDAQGMLTKIRSHKGLSGPITLPGHDMKLGRGGIREIEFFAQTHQLIHGGRDARLRVRQTVRALSRLAGTGRIAPEMSAHLIEAYGAHREVEHRLQMVRDSQTHTLPKTDVEFERLAALMGQDRAALEASLTTRLEEVHAQIDGFFAPRRPSRAPSEGFGEELTARWPTYPALRSTRGAEIFNRLKPEILAGLEAAQRPDEALSQFDGFLRGLPAGVQLFSLFEANPSLVDLIVDICATAPRLAVYLSRNAQVLDAVLDGGFFAPWPGKQVLRREASGLIASDEDFENALDRIRIWTREWHFRVGVHHLRGLIDAFEAGRQYNDLARAVLLALWPVVEQDVARRYGRLEGSGAVALGMGSLGAGRLHAASDLDLIVIYDPGPAEMSDGPKPVTASVYYGKFTQRLITALSALTAEGRLYEVDMRLRPSGRQGPVATSVTAFEDYQTREAWTWEHLALTRARVVAGSAPLARRVERFRRGLLLGRQSQDAVWPDLAQMRERIFSAKGSGTAWGAKIGPGRLQDVELFAQGVALLARSPARDVQSQLIAGVSQGLVPEGEAGVLVGTAELFWTVQATLQLLGLRETAPLAGGREMLLKATGHVSLEDLEGAMGTQAEAAAAIIDGVIR